MLKNIMLMRVCNQNADTISAGHSFHPLVGHIVLFSHRHTVALKTFTKPPWHILSFFAVPGPSSPRSQGMLTSVATPVGLFDDTMSSIGVFTCRVEIYTVKPVKRSVERKAGDHINIRPAAVQCNAQEDAARAMARVRRRDVGPQPAIAHTASRILNQRLTTQMRFSHDQMTARG